MSPRINTTQKCRAKYFIYLFFYNKGKSYQSYIRDKKIFSISKIIWYFYNHGCKFYIQLLGAIHTAKIVIGDNF